MSHVAHFIMLLQMKVIPSSVNLHVAAARKKKQSLSYTQDGYYIIYHLCLRMQEAMTNGQPDNQIHTCTDRFAVMYTCKNK